MRSLCGHVDVIGCAGARYGCPEVRKQTGIDREVVNDLLGRRRRHHADLKSELAIRQTRRRIIHRVVGDRASGNQCALLNQRVDKPIHALQDRIDEAVGDGLVSEGERTVLDALLHNVEGPANGDKRGHCAARREARCAVAPCPVAGTESVEDRHDADRVQRVRV